MELSLLEFSLLQIKRSGDLSLARFVSQISKSGAFSRQTHTLVLC